MRRLSGVLPSPMRDRPWMCCRHRRAPSQGAVSRRGRVEPMGVDCDNSGRPIAGAGLGQSHAQSMERWARIALDDDWVGSWLEGAIFPTEIVFFLASCEANGIRYIIESGRQDGYSTRILGEYARRTGVLVTS